MRIDVKRNSYIAMPHKVLQCLWIHAGFRHIATIRVPANMRRDIRHLHPIDNALQRNPKDQTEVNTSSRRVARQVLIYLESADKNAKPRYTFGNGAIPTGNSRPSNYFKNKPTSKDILIQIFHTKKGKVVAINFGKNGYIVTMIAGKEPTIVKDGNCLPSSEK